MIGGEKKVDTWSIHGWSIGVTVVLLDHSFYPNRNRTSSSRFCRFPLKYWMDKHFLLYDGMWDNLFIFIDVCAALIALTVWFQQIYFQSSCGIRIAIHWQYMTRITVTWCDSLSRCVCYAVPMKCYKVISLDAIYPEQLFINNMQCGLQQTW